MNAQATRKAIAKRTNSKGITYALVTDGTMFEVWKLCENYNGNVRGGISKTWRYVKKDMLEQEARKLFDIRTK